MKFYLLLTITTLIGSVMAQAQTQAEMNKLAADGYKKATRELDSVYQRIFEKYSGDETFLKALKESQANWLVFRASELKMKYPPREPGYYGSIHSMCVSLYMEELTRIRTKSLKLWLAGTDEGDACAGTIMAPAIPEDH